MIMLTLGFMACNHCEKAVLEPCGEVPQPNSEYCNMSVATCYSEDPAGDVGVIYDTRYNSAAPQGDDWKTTTSSTPVTAINPSNWVAGKIGQIFGIAIDDDQNIYLASSDIYYYDGSFPSVIPSSNPGRPFGCGQIFKCSPPGFTAVPLVALPNDCDPLNGVGNIAYDRWNNQLFATNLDDGMIYQLDVNGNIINTFDPWSADTGAPGMVNQDERVWGIGVNKDGNKVKLYFPRVTSTERSIYTVTLVNGNFPAAGSEVLEIANVPGDQPIISDVAFSSNTEEMLISERGQPHGANVMSYSLNSGSWSLNTTYFVGRNNTSSGTDGENSAGGVDFAYTERNGNVSEECDQFFWATGNYMLARNSSLNIIYGMQGIDYSGNSSSQLASPFANQDTDLFIDFDGVGGTSPKRTIGDVEVFDCTECKDPCELYDDPN